MCTNYFHFASDGTIHVTHKMFNIVGTIIGICMVGVTRAAISVT